MKDYQLFRDYEADDVRSYHKNHKDGNVLADSDDTSWFSEAQRTGEYLPGRQQVPLSVDFGTSSREEHTRSCRNNYSKSE